MFHKSQIQAISHMEGPAMVLAGPGSGKTTVITHRVKNLIEQNIPPLKIMVVTFTKVAAANMQKRFLQIMYGDPYKNVSYPVTFGTFHSIYYHILRQSRPYKNSDIVTEYNKNIILKEIVFRLKVDAVSMRDLVQDIAGEISVVKGNRLMLEQYLPKCCKRNDFIKIYSEYEQELKARGKIDFDDILIQCHNLLKNNTNVREKWQQIYEYILIDEFQDINSVQYEIIKMLAMPRDNIFIVGDDDQSIYGFRGACPEIMLKFKKDFPQTKQIIMNINYRSSPQIVSLSENLISHNSVHLKKNMVSAHVQGCVPDIRQFHNQWEELKYVCFKVKEYVQRGIDAKEIAILVRNNSQMHEIQNFLKNHGIKTGSPNHKNSVYEGMVAEDILAYVRASLTYESSFLNENEDFIRIVNKPERYISRKVLGQEQMNFDKLKEIYAHSSEIYENIVNLKFHLYMIQKLNPKAAVTYIRNGAGYEPYLKEYAAERGLHFSALSGQMDEILNDAAKFSTLKEWLEFLGQKEEVDIDTKQEQINVLTMHRAKGLEFKVVFILDANQGIIPSSQAVRDRDFQEERRVFYVAVTRASEYLHIYGVANRLGCKVQMSMFAAECLEESQTGVVNFL